LQSPSLDWYFFQFILFDNLGLAILLFFTSFQVSSAAATPAKAGDFFQAAWHTFFLMIAK
jgi:hypothetical protein